MSNTACDVRQRFNTNTSWHALSLYVYEEREGAMAAISELLCDVTVLTQGNHGNQFAAQVQMDEREKEIRTVWRVWSVNGKL